MEPRKPENEKSFIFEIEPLEERIAPSAMSADSGDTTNHGGWTQSGDGYVFLGYDPPPPR